jgi:hypothetical protein
MNEIIQKLAQAIVAEMDEKNPDWFHATYAIQATPAVNIGYQMELDVFDRDNRAIDNSMIWLNSSDDDKKNLFITANKEKQTNKATFRFKNKQLASFTLDWGQSIQDEFNLYLPKSKKGKIKAWYLP